ncbi:MAG: choice-of-anchor L domain-containing protein [Bacteroidales bacterium]|nr:choice-of-anchor L domain-containing protein [Bacteroidales bacterium]
MLFAVQIITAQTGNQNPRVSQRIPEQRVAPKVTGKSASGSIAVNENAAYAAYSATQLVQNLLVTGCLQASNVTFTGLWNASNADQRGLGYFNKGTSNFPIDEGLILSTGYIADAEGPNNSPSLTREVGTSGDADLQFISGYTTYDASVLEFDFIPAGNVVEFRYVFASEEYLEWSCSQFNDVFAFLLSGPGITNDPGLTGKNIARLPDGITPVTINNIHAQGRYSPASHNRNWANDPTCPAQNAAYYVDNGDGTTSSGGNGGGIYMQYDGRTVVLTAYHTVVPCQTYHIKLALADVSDRKWDSGIFLEGNSFSSEQVALSHIGNGIPNNNNIFEGCTDNSLTITRQTTDLSQEYVVDILLSGTAVNGTDILTSGGQPFPAQITIPAGQATYVIPYYAVNDGAGDNAETFIVRIRNSCPCAENVVYVEQDIYIYEQVIISSISATNAQCSGQSNGVITVNATGGSGSYQYSINNGSTWQTSNTFTGLAAGSYTILVRDPGSCYSPVSGSATIGSPTPIVANAGPDATICSGLSTQLNGSGGVLYSWSPATGLNNPNIANPIANPSVTTTYTLTVTNASGACPSSDQVVVNVNPSPSVTVDPTEIEICNGNSTTITASGAASYIWNPGGATNASITVSPASNSSYTVTGTAANDCTGSATSTVVVKPAPAAAINTPTTTILTCSVTSINLTATGGGSYSWSDGTNIVGTTATLNVTAPGTYTVTVTLANGCSDTESIVITQDIAVPTAGITPPTATILTCSVTSINLTATGGGSYSWSDGTNIVGTTATLNVTAPGTYTVTVTLANGCSDTESITITQDIAAPTAGITPPSTTILTCSVTSINLTATGGGSYSWSDGTNIVGTTATLNVTAPGTYTVTVTLANGCSDTESIVITQDIAVPTAGITPPTTTILTCSVTSINLTATGGGSYSWSDGTNIVGTTATLNVTAPGTYTVTVTLGQWLF